MKAQYRCKNQARRGLLEGQEAGKERVNGVDWLEVSDDQRTLRVHFVFPLPSQPGAVPKTGPELLAHNVQIVGGVRVPRVNVTGVRSQGRVLVVDVDQAGDYSPYVLRIVRSHAAPEPPAGFDPQLSEVEFSFKVDCSSPFDCAPDDECRDERPEEPPVDYLARDYASFRRLMLDRMSLVAPGWTERNPSDLGVTLVEALAYVADELSYAQDAAGTEAYLGTARRRPSVRRHARSLDYRMHDGCNARAWVFLEVGVEVDAVTLKPVEGPRRTRFLTPVPGAVALDQVAYETAVRDHAPQVFEPLHEVVLRAAHNEVHIHDWGDEGCCLPRGATRATLVSRPGVSFQPGDLLLFEEVRGPRSGLPEDADPAHRWVVRLTAVSKESVDELTKPPRTRVVEVEWAREDALPFPLCVSSRVGDRVVRGVSVARGNVVLADHGRTLGDDEAEGALLPATVPASGPYEPRLRDAGVTQRAPLAPLKLRRGPASALLRQDPADALPAVTLVSERKAWRPRRDLLASARFAREFVLETEEGGAARLRFGDGFHGRRPRPGAAFAARVRLGNGRAGNVGAEGLRHAVLSTDLRLLSVRNPIAATGGTDPEAMERVRQLAPAAFRDPRRAVTEGDYEDALERHPDVQTAVATRRWTGSWFTTFLAVDFKGGRPVDAKAERLLVEHLEPWRLAGHDLEIEPPRPVPLEIVMSVCVKPGHHAAIVHEALLDAFGSRELPDGRLGFFHPDRFTFGQSVRLSEVVAHAMAVPGVHWVDLEDQPHLKKRTRFRRWGEPSRGEWREGRIPIGRMEIARLDNDPSLPENGRIEFLMEGGA